MRTKSIKYCDMCGKEFDGSDDYYETIVSVKKHAGGHGDSTGMLLCSDGCGKKMFEYIRKLIEKGRKKMQKTINKRIIKDYEELQNGTN